MVPRREHSWIRNTFDCLVCLDIETLQEPHQSNNVFDDPVSSWLLAVCNDCDTCAGSSKDAG